MNRAWKASLVVAAAVWAGGWSGATVQGATSVVDDWPMFHHDITHSGVSAETTIGASNAASLGVDWEANTGGSVISSPAVVYNAGLAKRVVYIGNKKTLSAYDAATGNRLWYYATGRVTSSPAISGNVVYVGSATHYLYAINATTGKLDCRFLASGVIASSPTVVNPDGSGKVVYFGDNGLTGSDDGGNVWAVNAVDPNAAADCSVKWQFNSFNNPLTGVWSSPAFALDKNGTPLLVFGTGDPDDSVVAVNALTGQQVWQFPAAFGHDSDVGAGPTISAPGVNGFADGVVYIGTKYGHMYALNLRTGALIWDYDSRPDNTANPPSIRSTAALVGSRLYVGSSNGVYAFDATTGARVWLSAPLNTVSSPAISGAAGDQMLIVGDLAGNFHALALADGSELWSEPSGAPFVFSSAAISGGAAYIGAPNGFLFAFGIGGGTGAKPDTTVAIPANGSSLPNPSGALQTSGAATDDTGVQEVLVAVHDKSAGRWWDASTQLWSSVYQENPAALTDPGAPSTGWTLGFPVPAAGGNMTVEADAVDADGQRDPVPAASDFFVSSLGHPPDTTLDSPTRKTIYHFGLNPDGSIDYTPFPITITGTATDLGGANPGIARIKVSVKNIQHQEYYCGPSGCPGLPGVYWQSTYITFNATLASPGSTSTAWSASFPVYDHPHSYAISADAIDADGEKDTTKASVSPICVNNPGDNLC